MVEIPQISIPDTNPYVDDFCRDLGYMVKIKDLYTTYDTVLTMLGVKGHTRPLCISFICFAKSVIVNSHSLSSKWHRKKNYFLRYIAEIIKIVDHRSIDACEYVRPVNTITQTIWKFLRSFSDDEPTVDQDVKYIVSLVLTCRDFCHLQEQIDQVLNREQRYSANDMNMITIGLYAFLTFEPTEEMIETYVKLLFEIHYTDEIETKIVHLL